MCYRVEQKTSAKALSKRYNAIIGNAIEETLFYHVSGFQHPQLNILSWNEGPTIEAAQWGLIPNWNKPLEEMLQFSNNTLNAVSETIHEKISFKNYIGKERAILPVNGFFEYKHEGKDKLPYFIYPKDGEFFNLACVVSNYKNPETNIWLKTFSILTAPANEFMATIHNSKKRMPIMLDDNRINSWIHPDTMKSEVDNLFHTTNKDNYCAYRVSRDLIKIGNAPEAIKMVNI